MRIRVVDPIRWNRAKRIARGWVCATSFIAAIYFAGGLEGEQAPPSYTLAMLSLVVSLAAFPGNISSPPNTEGDTR